MTSFMSLHVNYSIKKEKKETYIPWIHWTIILKASDLNRSDSAFNKSITSLYVDLNWVLRLLEVPFILKIHIMIALRNIYFHSKSTIYS